MENKYLFPFIAMCILGAGFLFGCKKSNESNFCDDFHYDKYEIRKLEERILHLPEGHGFEQFNHLKPSLTDVVKEYNDSLTSEIKTLKIKRHRQREECSNTHDPYKNSD